MRPAEVRVSTSMHGTWALEQFSQAGTFPSHLCRGQRSFLACRAGAYLDATVAAPLAGQADLLGLFGAGVHVD